MRAAVPALSDSNVAMFAAIALVVSLGLPTNAVPTVAAATGAGLFAAAAAIVAPVMGVVMMDYFVLRRQVLDTDALIDAGNRAGGPFWFWHGVNPRAAAAAAAGALIPLTHFITTAVAAASVGAGAAGFETVVAPGLALARGATLGAVVSSALYMIFNKIAPPGKSSSSDASYSYTTSSSSTSSFSTSYAANTTTSSAFAARVIAADGSATYMDDIIRAEVESLDRVTGAWGKGEMATQGARWEGPGAGPGLGQGQRPDDDDDDDDDSEIAQATDIRSRLARAFNLDSSANIVVQPAVDDADARYDAGPDGSGLGLNLDVGLGASLQAGLTAQLGRREARLDDLRGATRRGESVPEETLARVAADIDALKSELRTFKEGGSWYAAGAEGRLMSRAALEVGGYLNGAGGEWAQISEAAAAVTRLDAAIEKLAAEGDGNEGTVAEMDELEEQRTVWGLRLVSAQIKGIMGLQSAVLDEEDTALPGGAGAATSADGSGRVAGIKMKTNLTVEMKRLEKLTADKYALLERLSETERRGTVASTDAAALRAEVEALRSQLAATADAAMSGSGGGGGDTANWQQKWAVDRLALEKRLRRAEAKSALVEMQADNEVSVLFVEVKRLQSLLGEKETSLARIKWDAKTALLSQLRSDDPGRRLPSANVSSLEGSSADVGDLEGEIASLRGDISRLRGEMAEKDRSAGEATATLRAQLADAATALGASEDRLRDAKRREQEILASGSGDEAVRAAAVEAASAAARRDSIDLRAKLARAKEALKARESDAREAEADAQHKVDEALKAQSANETLATAAAGRVREVEEALAAKEIQLADALTAAESAGVRAATLTTTVDALETEIAEARATVVEKTAEVSLLMKAAQQRDVRRGLRFRVQGFGYKV
jgi:hypothetical protein